MDVRNTTLPADAEAALAAIPCDYERPAWVKLGFAYRAAGGGYANFLAWSKTHPQFQADGGATYVRTQWRSFATSREIGPATLYGEVFRRAPGWRKPSERTSDYVDPPAACRRAELGSLVLDEPRAEAEARPNGHDDTDWQGEAVSAIAASEPLPLSPIPRHGRRIRWQRSARSTTPRSRWRCAPASTRPSRRKAFGGRYFRDHGARERGDAGRSCPADLTLLCDRGRERWRQDQRRQRSSVRDRRPRRDAPCGGRGCMAELSNRPPRPRDCGQANRSQQGALAGRGRDGAGEARGAHAAPEPGFDPRRPHHARARAGVVNDASVPCVVDE